MDEYYVNLTVASDGVEAMEVLRRDRVLTDKDRGRI